MENNKYSESIWKMSNSLSNITLTKNVPFSLIRIYFIKYVIDNNIGAQTKEELNYYSNANKMFAEGDMEDGPRIIAYVLFRVDEMYGLDGLISNSINQYLKELFGLDNEWTKCNVSDIHFKKLMQEIAELDLSEADNKEGSFSVGKEIVANLLPVVYVTSKSYAGLLGEYFTQTSLANLVANILDIKDGDTFCDFSSGIGASTISIVGNADTKIFNTEINEEVAAISAMLYIMSGYKDIKVTVGDGLIDKKQNSKADKIFCDPPLKFVTEAINCTLDSLNDGGMAVLTVPNSILYKGHPWDIALRKRLIETGYINSVISLPPCWYGTRLTTNLLVLSKTVNKDILFVDATTNKYIKVYERERNNYKLANDGIKAIAEIFSERKEIESVSKVVSFFNNDFNLLPASYNETSICDESEHLSVEEINAKLKELYEQFGKIKETIIQDMIKT